MGLVVLIYCLCSISFQGICVPMMHLKILDQYDFWYTNSTWRALRSEHLWSSERCRCGLTITVAALGILGRVFKNYLDSSNSTQESYFKISHMLVFILLGKKIHDILRVVLSNFLYLRQARSKRNINTLIFFCKKLFGG